MTHLIHLVLSFFWSTKRRKIYSEPISRCFTGASFNYLPIKAQQCTIHHSLHPLPYYLPFRDRSKKGIKDLLEEYAVV